MSPASYQDLSVDNEVSEQVTDDEIVSQDDRDYFNSIINRQITPKNSRIVEVFWHEFDKTYYTLEETYMRGSGIVKANVQVLVTSLGETVESVEIVVT